MALEVKDIQEKIDSLLIDSQKYLAMYHQSQGAIQILKSLIIKSAEEEAEDETYDK